MPSRSVRLAAGPVAPPATRGCGASRPSECAPPRLGYASGSPACALRARRAKTIGRSAVATARLIPATASVVPTRWPSLTRANAVDGAHARVDDGCFSTQMAPLALCSATLLPLGCHTVFAGLVARLPARYGWLAGARRTHGGLPVACVASRRGKVMEAKSAPSANLPALPEGTELVGDYRIKRVLGAGGFGITYLADEQALGRLVTIKEYFPAEFAARRKYSAVPRSRDVTDDYQWGLDRFIEEAQTLARFDHPNVVRVHRYFRANDTAYMVLHFEEGGSFKAWLKGLKRAPQQAELDKMIAPLLDALEIIHDANFLHRDIAPDNIMVRKDGSPVLIDFGSARGAMASQSRTVSALVKPGYSPYEQYATSGANQGPWTDIYAVGATLYHAVAGKRPPDAPSRVVSDDYVPAREAALSSYRGTFLDAIDKALRLEIGERPQRIGEWRHALLAPAAAPEPERPVADQPARLPLARKLGRPQKAEAAVSKGRSRRAAAAAAAAAPQPTSVPASLVPAPPDAPQPKGQLLDFIEALRRHRPA